MSHSAFELHVTADAGDPRAESVLGWLRAFNLENSPLREMNASVPLRVFASDESGLIGGLLGETHVKWLKISILAVNPEHRKNGVGKALMAEAERDAIARGCTHVFVDTMSYQAPQFYIRLGYKIAAEIADWDSMGHAKFFLTKDLGGPA
ncbi:MAG TPA: GNAT family N-acetyltransferase [Planctomycetota bacterium]|nr:GNAT family N-acetyltransferase [Planctomycetota bacterium]